MTTSRVYNRAPKGGATINGKFYAGGQFTPAPAAPVAPEGRWIIRPRTIGTARDFRPVAIVGGREIVSGPMVGRLVTVAEARAWIATHYADGTTFPAPIDRTVNVASIDAVRAKYRFA